MPSERDKASENPYDAPFDVIPARAKRRGGIIPWLWAFGLAGAAAIILGIYAFVLVFVFLDNVYGTP